MKRAWNWEVLRQIMVITVLSGLAGSLVGVFASWAEADPLISGVMKGFVAGLIIGLAAQFSFTTVYIRFRNKTLPAYGVMTSLVGISTLLGCVILQIESSLHIFIVVLCSMLMSIIMARIIFAYSIKLNENLERKKKELEEEEPLT